MEQTQQFQDLEALLKVDDIAAHKVCKSNVPCPTIRVGERRYEDTKTSGVYFQWFGSVDGIATKKQFLFPITLGIESECWMGNPEKFHIVFIDQVKNWPNPQVAQRVADQATNGSLEDVVVWVCSHHIAKHRAPASFLVSIVLLGDPNMGVISPGKFSNMELLNCPECKR